MIGHETVDYRSSAAASLVSDVHFTTAAQGSSVFTTSSVSSLRWLIAWADDRQQLCYTAQHNGIRAVRFLSRVDGFSTAHQLCELVELLVDSMMMESLRW